MKPNRTDRRLHWRIELYKLAWITLGAQLGGIVTLWWNQIGGWPMALGWAIVAAMAVMLVSLGTVIVLELRKLPDE
jgi:hypothetical protein